MIANPVAYLERNATRYGDPFTLHLLGGNSPPVVFGMNPGERAHQLELLIEPFLESVNSTLNSVQFFWNPLQQDLGPWSPWGKFLRQQRQIDELIYAEIRDRRGQTDGSDVLSMLMSAQDEAGEGMGDAELRD